MHSKITLSGDSPVNLTNLFLIRRIMPGAPATEVMKIAYIAHQKIHIADADRQENAAGSQRQNYAYEQACFSEKIFQLKEDIQGLLSQIEENIDLK